MEPNRARKRPWAKHRLRKRASTYEITPLPSFRSRVTIHPPPESAVA